jgi:hypothetical protein
MSSISDKQRSLVTMKAAEVDDLIRAGWDIQVIQSLCDRGFRESCPMPHEDGSTSPSFLRQTTLPHLHIVLEKSATLEDLDTAIYDAGQQSRHQYLADQWHRFTDVMKAWHRPQKSTDLEARLTKLEATLKANASDQATASK